MGVRIYQAIKPDGSVLWEEERPIEWLEKKKRSMPPSLLAAIPLPEIAGTLSAGSLHSILLQLLQP